MVNFNQEIELSQKQRHMLKLIIWTLRYWGKWTLQNVGFPFQAKVNWKKKVSAQFYRYSLPKCCLNNFSPMFHFYTTWKRQKTFGFLTFSRGIEMEHWAKMGWSIRKWDHCQKQGQIYNRTTFNTHSPYDTEIQHRSRLKK